ncbi:MAG: septal ring lytic transglycosylase RlpA family protein [Rubrivivax sp.]|nr:septal ring lytic transglycosylase RlpA family protein [Rubrivivax sp.]
MIAPQPLRHRQALAVATAAALLLLAGCATRPPAADDRDGPGANPPPDLARVPDAVPRVEPLRVGGPNRPYVIAGRRHVPLTDDRPLAERGGASWYGRKFHGRPTSSGEPYDMYGMTAAHRTMPIPSYARVRNPANGREVVVRVNDRGPFVDGRVIDLSYTAALKLGVLGGVATVVVERITHDEIRRGNWSASLPPDDPAPGEAEAGAPVAAADGRFWLQLGAFRSRDGAQVLQQRLQAEAAALLPAVRVAEEDALQRVLGGPFASRAHAQAVAQRLRERTGLDALVVERP